MQRLPFNFIFAQRPFALYEIALQESSFFSKTTEPTLFFFFLHRFLQAFFPHNRLNMKEIVIESEKKCAGI